MQVLPPELVAPMYIEKLSLTTEEKERIYSQMQFFQDWKNQKQQAEQDQKNVRDAQNMYDRQQIKEGLAAEDRLKEVQSNLDQQMAKVDRDQQMLRDKSAALHVENLTPEQMQKLQNQLITNQMYEDKNGTE
jgi:hypothetical protein